MATVQEKIDAEFDEIDQWEDEPAPEETPADSGEPLEVESSLVESVKLEVPSVNDDQLAELREENRKADARYNSLQGMFNKQNEEMQALKAKLAELPVKTEPANTQPDIDSDYNVLVEEYGETAAKAMKSMAAKTLAATKKELDEIKKELEATRETTGYLQKATAQTAEERYFAELDKSVPDWRDLNGGNGKPQDPLFTELLTQTVPFQDYTYNDLLQYHHQQGNVAKVAEIFKAAKAKGQPVETPAPQANPLEQLLEPDKTGKGTALPDSNNKKTYTKAEVDKFDRDYMMYQSGKLKADADKIEARWNDIQDALIEGRVI